MLCFASQSNHSFIYFLRNDYCFIDKFFSWGYFKPLFILVSDTYFWLSHIFKWWLHYPSDPLIVKIVGSLKAVEGIFIVTAECSLDHNKAIHHYRRKSLWLLSLGKLFISCLSKNKSYSVGRKLRHQYSCNSYILDICVR